MLALRGGRDEVREGGGERRERQRQEMLLVGKGEYWEVEVKVAAEKELKE